jgi:CubicO group peptidase (beta-lactamase class C family)
VKRDPRFVLADPAASASITIEDLLCHRPGLQFGPIVFRDAYSGQIDDAIYFDLLSYVRPGPAPDYSNVNFTALGRMLETVAADGRYGQWRDVLKQRLFDPLGMTRTTGYASIAWGDANAAFPTEGTSSGSVVLPHKSDRTMQAAGGLCTTANDAAKYLLFHLGEGALGDTRLMPREFALDMRKQRTDDAQEMSPHFKANGFGLGWQVCAYRGEVLYGHGGGYAGASAYFAFLPERGIAAAVMINRASTSTMALTLSDVMDTLLGREPDPALLAEVRRVGNNARWAAPSPPATNPVTKDGALSLAPEIYVGSYADDQHGVIEVKLEQGELTLALGDIACQLDSAGKDAFRALRGPLDTYTGHFELADDGQSVEYVVFRIDDGEAPIWFERQ